MLLLFILLSLGNSLPLHGKIYLINHHQHINIAEKISQLGAKIVYIAINDTIPSIPEYFDIFYYQQEPDDRDFFTKLLYDQPISFDPRNKDFMWRFARKYIVNLLSPFEGDYRLSFDDYYDEIVINGTNGYYSKSIAFTDFVINPYINVGDKPFQNSTYLQIGCDDVNYMKEMHNLGARIVCTVCYFYHLDIPHYVRIMRLNLFNQYEFNELFRLKYGNAQYFYLSKFDCSSELSLYYQGKSNGFTKTYELHVLNMKFVWKSTEM